MLTGLWLHKLLVRTTPLQLPLLAHTMATAAGPAATDTGILPKIAHNMLVNVKTKDVSSVLLCMCGSNKMFFCCCRALP